MHILQSNSPPARRLSRPQLARDTSGRISRSHESVEKLTKYVKRIRNICMYAGKDISLQSELNSETIDKVKNNTTQ